MADAILKCPGCDKSLQFDEQMESAFCIHCGNKIIIKEAIEKGKCRKGTVENNIRENIKQTDDKISSLNAAWNVIIKHFRNIIGKIRILTPEERENFNKYRIISSICYA